MEEIKVMPKPDWISWDEIHELLYIAHEKNRNNGFTMNTAMISGAELEKKVGKGRCFVALEGKKLVGTTSVGINEGNKWFDKGIIVAHGMLSGILPAYQGCGIMEDLHALRDKYLEELGVDAIWGGTAEDNKIMRKIVARKGFVNVDYLTSHSANYYSVIFVKWLKKSPYPLWYCNFRFKWARFWTRFRYKPGKVERFRTIGFAARVIGKLKRIIKR